MKTKELIQRIISAYNKGVQTDTSRLTARHVYNKMLTVRKRLISQQVKKKQRVSAWNYQTIPCIELIEVPLHECPCVPLEGCTILRSKYMIPKPLHALDRSTISMVSSIDRRIKIDFINLGQANYVAGNKYASNKSKYFVHNEYIYVMTDLPLEVIMLVGLFEDPHVALKFPSLCKGLENCPECIDILEEDFPIDGDLEEALIALTAQEILGGLTTDPNYITRDEEDPNQENN